MLFPLKKEERERTEKLEEGCPSERGWVSFLPEGGQHSEERPEGALRWWCHLVLSLWEMDELLQIGRQLGLSVEEVGSCLRFDRPLSECNWCIANDAGRQALEIARDLFETGRLIEYHCYDDHGNNQGRGVLELQQWEDTSDGLFGAKHGQSSDAYYDWYAQNELSKGAVYHVCQGSAKSCRRRLPRGDKRILIHVDRWRLLTPQVMVDQGYLKSQGVALGRAAIEERAKAKAPVYPGATGLDAALAAPQAPLGDGGARGSQEDAPRPREAEKKDRRRSRSRGRRRHLADKIADQEKKKAEEQDKEADEKERRKKTKKRKGDKGRRRRDSPSSGSSSRSSSATSSGSLFRPSSVRGGDLWRLSQKKPGRLTEMALKRMSRYLAGQAERGLEASAWENQKVLAYLNQIVLTAAPPAKIGVRAHRELVTLATALDELLASRTLHCLDVLMQRFKAVEVSIQDGHWSLARHYELILAAGAMLSREEEREMATKAEVRQLKLKEAISKSGKNSK